MNKGAGEVETISLFSRRDYPVYVLLSGLFLSAAGYFFSYWFGLNGWREHPGVFTGMTLILLAFLAFSFFNWFLLSQMRKPVRMTPEEGLRVAVVTTFVPGAESFDMLKETLTALTRLDYPHDVWVLDEGDASEVRAFCASSGVRHFTRKNSPRFRTPEGVFKAKSKHGNYNAWLFSVGFDAYDAVVFFDPDHVPAPAFLTSVLGYFKDPAIGYVQAPQAYYNQAASFIARGAAEETYAYYSSVQMACYRLGYPIITGCHNAHRTAALRQINGLAAHDADDLLTTLHYRKAGWTGVYVPEILARGLTPVDWPGYLNQQRRWARSVLDIKFRIFPKISGELPLLTRFISFLHGLSYIQESVIALIGLIQLSYILASGKIPVLSHLFGSKLLILFVVVKACEFYAQRFYLDPRREWGLHWRAAVLRYAKWPYILLGLTEVIMNRQVPYRLTVKVKSASNAWRLMTPYVITAAVVIASWAYGILSNEIMLPSLHFWAGLMGLGSLILAGTVFFDYPEPFDKRLLKTARPE